MGFLELAKERYSVRSFKDRQVEDDKIQKILDAGSLAPTARNSQPQQVYVLTSEEAMKAINEVCVCIYGAPMAFVIGYDKTRVARVKDRENYDFGEMDSTIVCTHMMLEAADLGLGTCWVGKFNDDAVSEALGLPETMQVTAILPCGYPADDSCPIAMHSECRPQEEMIRFI